jgi:hypothetical protein
MVFALRFDAIPHSFCSQPRRKNWHKKIIFTLTEQYIKRLRVNVNNIFTESLL